MAARGGSCLKCGKTTDINPKTGTYHKLCYRCNSIQQKSKIMTCSNPIRFDGSLCGNSLQFNNKLCGRCYGKGYCENLCGNLIEFPESKPRTKLCEQCPHTSVLQQLRKPVKRNDQKSWLFSVLQIDVAIIFSFLTMNEAWNFRSSCQKMYDYVRLFPWNTKALTVLPKNFRHWKVHFPNMVIENQIIFLLSNISIK